MWLSLQSQAIQGVIMVILIIYKEESEIPRHAHGEEKRRRRKKKKKEIRSTYFRAISHCNLN